MMHGMALFFELGIVAVTLASLLSGMRHPDLSDEAVKKRNGEVVATFVSLGTTVLTFALTMLGAGDTVQGLRALGNRISAAGTVVAGNMSALGERMHAQVHPTTQFIE